MGADYRFRPWIIDNWSRLTLVLAVVILALLPALATDGNRKLILATLLLPAYLIHQYEEHAHGRFIAVLNATLGKGHPILTRESVFWMNMLGVWVLFIASLLLARAVDVGFVLIPVYLTIFNGITHVLGTVVLRRYNPGLWTSLAVFLPLGFALLISFSRSIESSLLFNAIGLATAIIIHAAIALHVVKRRRGLMADSRAATSQSLDLSTPVEVQ